MRTVGLGIALGIVLSLALGRLVRSMLCGTSPRDPVVFIAVAAVLAEVGALAAALPASGAARVDPMVALRND